MPALIINIADAIVAEILGHDWGRELSAERVYRPMAKVKDLVDMKVSVMPAKLDATIASRGSDEYEPEVDIGIQQGRVGPDDQVELDSLLEFVETMAAWFRGRQLISWPTARITEANISVLWLPEHLTKYRVFTSVITVKAKFTVTNERN